MSKIKQAPDYAPASYGPSILQPISCALSWALASHQPEISLPLQKLGRREEARKHLDNALATPPGEVTQVPATGPSISELFPLRVG